jgi:hypothetical protein
MRNPFKRNNQYTVTSEELAEALRIKHPKRDGVYVEFTIEEKDGKRHVVRTQVKKHKK